MREFNLNKLGDELTLMIKKASWFPFKSGHLRHDATQGAMYTATTYRIHFDSSIAPYVTYLEEGTGPHDIFPVNKRFLKFTKDGKTIFSKHVHHPGSTKHKGFISNKAVNSIVNYIATIYEGEVTIE